MFFSKLRDVARLGMKCDFCGFFFFIPKIHQVKITLPLSKVYFAQNSVDLTSKVSNH